MKLEIEVECTPVEARTFLGLPDMTPLHEAWIERMKSLGLDGPSVEDWQKLASNWSAGMPGLKSGMEGWQKLMWAATGMGGKNEDKPE